MTPTPGPDTRPTSVESEGPELDTTADGATAADKPALFPGFLDDTQFRVSAGVYFLPGLRLNG